MYGSKDQLFPLEDGLDICEAIGSNASLIGIPMCSHFPHLEEPELIMNHIMKFTNECEKINISRPSFTRK